MWETRLRAQDCPEKCTKAPIHPWGANLGDCPQEPHGGRGHSDQCIAGHCARNLPWMARQISMAHVVPLTEELRVDQSKQNCQRAVRSMPEIYSVVIALCVDTTSASGYTWVNSSTNTAHGKPVMVSTCPSNWSQSCHEKSFPPLYSVPRLRSTHRYPLGFTQ